MFAEAQKRGISQAGIDNVATLIAELEKLKETQKRETAEAQMATEACDKEFEV
ncbi:MAG: hypothetical protein Q4G63_04195 [Bacteroidia bacterium]|nr:hypothetical protein [Bacteroidia bacterium]